MASGSEILRELFISLGWQYDEASAKKVAQSERKTSQALEKESKDRESFAKKGRESLEATAKGFLKLTAIAEAAALGVTAAVERMARSFEAAYYASSRTGSSVKEMNAFKFAASQMGSSADEAQSAIEGLARAQREMPGYATILKKLGATDPNNLAKSLNDIAPRLAQMPLAQAEAYAKLLHIPENLLLAMRKVEEFRKFEAQNTAKYNILGFDPEKAAEDGKNLTRIFRNLYDTVEKIGESIGSKLFGDLKGPIADLNDYLLAHGKEIADTIVKIADALFRMLDYLVRNLPRLDHFVESMGGWSRVFAGLAAVVTAAFVGRVSGLLAALSGIAALSMPEWALALLGVTAATEIGRQAEQAHFGPLTPDEAQKRSEGTKKFDESGWNPLNWFKPSWWKKGSHGGGGNGTSSPDTPVGPPARPGTYRPQYNLSQADLSDSVVAKINGEATSSQESTDAVINNMFNRLGTKTYGPSGNLTQVAFAPGQYAGYRRADAKRAEYIRSRIRAIAAGSVADNTHGSNEYRASSYRGPWYRHHAGAPVVGGNRFAYNPDGGTGPYAPYPEPHLVKTPPMVRGDSDWAGHRGGHPPVPKIVNPFGGLNADKLRSQMMGGGMPLGGAPGDSSKNVTIHQTNNNHVTGVSDPTAAAAQIGARHDKHSSMLVRNMQSAIA